MTFDSIKNLPDAVRNKAIEIAASLLKEKKMTETNAVKTALERVKEFMAGSDIRTTDDMHASRMLGKRPGDRHVITRG